jgi:AhpD family alkylhydroperoxidase
MKQRMNTNTLAAPAIAGFLSVEKYLNECGLDHRLLHLLKTRASQMNGCAYCLHMHTSDARKLGESEARLYLLPAWRESTMYTARERAALGWIEAVTDITDGHVDDAMYEEVRAHFSEKEVADLTVAAAMINAWNRLAIAARAHHPHDRATA